MTSKGAEECVSLAGSAKCDTAKEMELGSVHPIVAHQQTRIQRWVRIYGVVIVDPRRIMTGKGEMIDDTLAYLDRKFARLHAR